MDDLQRVASVQGVFRISDYNPISLCDSSILMASSGRSIQLRAFVPGVWRMFLDLVVAMSLAPLRMVKMPWVVRSYTRVEAAWLVSETFPDSASNMPDLPGESCLYNNKRPEGHTLRFSSTQACTWLVLWQCPQIL